MVRAALYTAKTKKPSFGMEQRPSRTRGRWETQLESAALAPREGFKEKWKRSIIPLAWGWKLVVWKVEIPRKQHTLDQTDDVNCAPLPLSEVRVAGTPNLKIQVEMEALTQTSVETKDKGTASGQQVVQSLLGCMKSFD